MCTQLKETAIMITGREIDGQGVYQIKVQGRLDERWTDWFSGMTITCERGSDGSPITVLTGAVADQSVLRGILGSVWDLNLTLVSVVRIDVDPK
jgi:hypothetical protein